MSYRLIKIAHGAPSVFQAIDSAVLDVSLSY